MKKVIILSGAGLSAESGLGTFRDNGGLWENFDVMEVCSIEGYLKNPELVHTFYDNRRVELAEKLPNESHYMMYRLQQRFPESIVIITQNVDDLLEKAGCTNVIHLHGKLRELRCTMCEATWDIGYDLLRNHNCCPTCNCSTARHNIVMFGEPAPMYASLHAHIQQADLLVVIGTSGAVLPIAQYGRFVSYSILNNLEPSELIPNHCFDVTLYEKATLAASKVEKLVIEFMNRR